MSNTCAFTGHRPDKLNGYNPKDNSKLLWELHRVIVDHIENKSVTVFINGVALGIDTWAAKIVIKLRETKYPYLRLVSAVPCRNQASRWPVESQKEWQYVIDNSDEVVYVSEEYTPYCMQARNVWMVDNSDYIIAVHDGSAGGTGNCVNYVRKKNKEITVINPNNFK